MNSHQIWLSNHGYIKTRISPLRWGKIPKGEDSKIVSFNFQPPQKNNNWTTLNICKRKANWTTFYKIYIYIIIIIYCKYIYIIILRFFCSKGVSHLGGIFSQIRIEGSKANQPVTRESLLILVMMTTNGRLLSLNLFSAQRVANTLHITWEQQCESCKTLINTQINIIQIAKGLQTPNL